MLYSVFLRSENLVPCYASEPSHESFNNLLRNSIIYVHDVYKNIQNSDAGWTRTNISFKSK